MAKHKTILNDKLANSMLKKHPKFAGMYYKKLKLNLGTEHELASVRIARHINKEKVHGHTVEMNEDTISIWDLRGSLPADTEGVSNSYTGNTQYPLVKLSVRANRKDLGLLVDDIDFAIQVLQEVQADIKKEQE
jgi:hypothetical protein